MAGRSKHMRAYASRVTLVASSESHTQSERAAQPKKINYSMPFVDSYLPPKTDTAELHILFHHSPGMAAAEEAVELERDFVEPDRVPSSNYLMNAIPTERSGRSSELALSDDDEGDEYFDADEEMPCRGPSSDPVEDLFAELLHTEKSYVADLRTMVSVYARPAQKLSILTAEDRQAIFGNAEQLLSVAEALLDELRKAGRPEDVVAQSFISVAPYFKLYASYCKNYTTALETAQRCRNQSDGFAEFLKSQSSRQESRGLQLESFLIKPVQRLLKYPLFFQGLLKESQLAEGDRSQLLKAQQLVLEISSSVNRQQATDGVTLLQAVLHGLGENYLRLLAPHRKLRMRFKCAVTTDQRSFSAVGFLMTDLLLVCERPAGELRQSRAGKNVQVTLKPWLLAPLGDLLMGDDALDGDRGRFVGSLISEPVTPYNIPIRVEASSWSKATRKGPDSPDPLHRQLSDQREQAGSTVLQKAPSWGKRTSSSSSADKASSSSSLVDLSDELFRLELADAEARDEVQRAFEAQLSKLTEMQMEARRPERRLKSVNLDDASVEVCMDLARARQEVAGSESSSSMWLGSKGRAATSKEDLRRHLQDDTPPAAPPSAKQSSVSSRCSFSTRSISRLSSSGEMSGSSTNSGRLSSRMSGLRLSRRSFDGQSEMLGAESSLPFSMDALLAESSKGWEHYDD